MAYWISERDAMRRNFFCTIETLRLKIMVKYNMPEQKHIRHVSSPSQSDPPAQSR
jgi:hypothetical protein